jgi:putative copper export protein
MDSMGDMSHMSGMFHPFSPRILCEIPMLTAMLLVFGLAAFTAAILPPQSELEFTPARLWTTMRAVALVPLILAPLQLAIQTAAMAGTTMAQAMPLVGEVIHETHFGAVWQASVPLLLALAAVAWIPGRTRLRAWLIALIGAALLALWALISHAFDYGRLAVALYVVHEAGAGLWAGALLGLVLMTADGKIQRPAATRIVHRVSRLAGWCVAALVVSGVYIAYRSLGLSLNHLLYSAYGRTLIVKVGVFGILVALGGYNRYRLMPRFNAASVRGELMRSVRVECLLIAGVFVLAVVLANTPPTH